MAGRAATRGAVEREVARLVASHRRRPRSSARTLLVTVFGDSVEPHGGVVWLGSLARLVAPLGINDRLVRTSLNRLVREGILVAELVGRRSYYSIAPGSRHDFARAERRIYHGIDDDWDGRWTTVLVPPAAGDEERRVLLRERLRWMGFGQPAVGAHVSPTVQLEEVEDLLGELGLAQEVVVVRDVVHGMSDRELARRTSDLDDVGRGYEELVKRYRPLDQVLGDGIEVEPEAAFLARTLLVNDYRRLLLREPELPSALWPDGWVGHEARALAARVYRGIARAADAHLEGVAETPTGPLPPTAPVFARRFVVDDG